jgi:hypothetical protein
LPNRAALIFGCVGSGVMLGFFMNHAVGIWVALVFFTAVAVAVNILLAASAGTSDFLP